MYMQIKVKQYKSQYTVGIKHQAKTKHGLFTMEAGTLETKIRNIIYGGK